jgi:hypothetical protein
VAGIRRRFDASADGARAPFEDGLRGAAETLWSGDSEVLRGALSREFASYVTQLDARR